MGGDGSGDDDNDDDVVVVDVDVDTGDDVPMRCNDGGSEQLDFFYNPCCSLSFSLLFLVQSRKEGTHYQRGNESWVMSWWGECKDERPLLTELN